MCGRYYRRSDKQRIAEAFKLGHLPEDFVLSEDYNVAPSTAQPIIRQSRDPGERELVLMRWGLLPFFATDPASFKGFSTINAKAETLTTNSTWRRPFERRRCLVPADGFYEWKPLASTGSAKPARQPYAFELRTKAPFAFAGLWDAWKEPVGGWLQSFAIITTDANAVTAPVHNRMPVILRAADYDRWLSRNSVGQPPLDLLRPYDADAMTSHLVDPRVGNVRNNEPGLCQPWTGESCPPNSA